MLLNCDMLFTHILMCLNSLPLFSLLRLLYSIFYSKLTKSDSVNMFRGHIKHIRDLRIWRRKGFTNEEERERRKDRSVCSCEGSFCSINTTVLI